MKKKEKLIQIIGAFSQAVKTSAMGRPVSKPKKKSTKKDKGARR